jgi:hypothetical protein
MKTKLLLVLILLAQTFYAQDLTGSWRGEIDLGAMKLPLLLISKKKTMLMFLLREVQSKETKLLQSIKPNSVTMN